MASHVRGLGSRFVVITQDSLLPLYGKPLQETLRAEGLTTHLFSFPNGEKYKTRTTKETLENALFEAECGKDTCLIALGGGVVLDLVGYLAATYCRGVPLVLIPTSLLSMVDACIGGKTGVNTPYGKNLVGCFYPAKHTLIDSNFVNSLSINEIRNGVIEMIKHALITDEALFVYLETHVDSILELGPDYIDFVITTNIQIKKAIVEADPTEKGKRHTLNLGHTVGHALEQLTHHALSHGEAVALGLLVEADVALQLGTLSESEWNRILALLKSYSLPLQWPSHINPTQLLQAMVLDKKTANRAPRLVLLNGIGSTLECDGHYCTSVEEKIWIHAVKKVENALRRD